MKKLLGMIAGIAAGVLLALGGAVPARAAFSDVAPGAWYEQDVSAMAEAGALTGYPDGSFRPGRAITAAEFVSVAARLAKLPEGRGQTAHWAAGRMQSALEAGWYDWDELPPHRGEVRPAHPPAAGGEGAGAGLPARRPGGL